MRALYLSHIARPVTRLGTKTVLNVVIATLSCVLTVSYLPACLNELNALNACIAFVAYIHSATRFSVQKHSFRSS